MVKYLCENYHPHVRAIVTPTSVEVMEGIQAVPNIKIMDYGFKII